MEHVDGKCAETVGGGLRDALVSAFFLWIGEVFIGLGPLLIHTVVHRFLESPSKLARCVVDSDLFP